MDIKRQTFKTEIQLKDLGGLLAGVLPTQLVALWVHGMDILTCAYKDVRVQVAINQVGAEGATGEPVEKFSTTEGYIAIQTVATYSGPIRRQLVTVDDDYPAANLNGKRVLGEIGAAVDDMFGGKYGGMTALASRYDKGTVLFVDVATKQVTTLPSTGRVRTASFIPGASIMYTNKIGEIQMLDENNAGKLLAGEGFKTIDGGFKVRGKHHTCTRYYRADDSTTFNLGVHIEDETGKREILTLKGEKDETGKLTFSSLGTNEIDNGIQRVVGLEGTAPWKKDKVGLSTFAKDDDGFPLPTIGGVEQFEAAGIPGASIEDIGRKLAAPIRAAA